MRPSNRRAHFWILAAMLTAAACGDEPRDTPTDPPAGRPPILADATATREPTVTTDRPDYAPGDTVTITGTGWLPGESVRLVLHEEPQLHDDRTLWATADSAGRFTNREFAPEEHHLGITFTLTATGQTSGRTAQTTFTDGEARITDVDPAAFSPGASPGVKDSTAITFRNAGAGSINGAEIRIRAGTAIGGTLVRTFSLGTVAQNTNVIRFWNGRDTGGSPVAEGIYTARAFATGQVENDGEKETIIVDNTPPTITINSIPNGAPGVPMTITGTAADPLSDLADLGGGKLSIVVRRVSDNAILAGPTIRPVTGGGAWSFDYTPGQTGLQRVEVTGTDNAGNSATATATFNVAAANTAPTLGAIGNRSVDEETTLSFTATATDPDAGQTLTFSLVGAPAGATINGSSGAFSWTPTEAQGPGSYTFTIRVTDSGSPAASDEETITVTVNEVNKAPVWSPVAPQTVDEGSPLSVTVSATDPDIPANLITYSAVTLPSGASFDPATRTFSWTPGEADGPGSYTVTLRATDNGSPPLSADLSFQVTVHEVNQAPTLSGVPASHTMDEQTPFTFTATASDPDLPPNTLTFSLIGAPAGATISSTGAFSWTPSESQDGTYTFRVCVTDNGSPALFDEDTITVTVKEVNRPPVLTSVPATGSVNEGSTFSFDADATDPDTVAGVPNTLTFSLAGAPAGASINGSTGQFSWSPADDDPTGTPSDLYPFKVVVTDNGSPTLADTSGIQITVNNLPPTLNTPSTASLLGPLTPVPVGSPVSVGAVFTDPGTLDTHTLYVTWDIGQTPVAYSNYTSGNPITRTDLPAGVYTITVEVRDDDTGSSGPYTFSQYIVVYDPNGGFVTGGGWIDSPAGACRLTTACESATGKATFGFVSKYLPGASTPSGNTEFHFQAGNLKFRSTSYQWLVISGARAQYKGYGTINGAGDYGFLLTAIDGQLNGGGGTDRFRIKIWERSTGTVVYDNQMGAAEDSDAATAVGGGSITIHKK